MAAQMAMVADGGDPRLNVGAALPETYAGITPQQRLLHDPDVTFEEYHYYALRTRAEEDELERNDTGKTGLRQVIFPPKSTPAFKDPHATYAAESDSPERDPEKRSAAINDLNLSTKVNRMAITDTEWTNASRAFRTATWAACFYLITTDILGPFGIGYVRAFTFLQLDLTRIAFRLVHSDGVLVSLYLQHSA